MLMITSKTHLDHFLNTVPSSITKLGELISDSVHKDFGLLHDTENRDFKYRQYRDSFKACFASISQEERSAFYNASNNMREIRHYSTTVKEHVDTAVNILIKDDREAVELVLPKSLSKVNCSAEKCKDLAIDIENKFIRVMNANVELLETCIAAQSSYQQKYDDAVGEKETARNKKDVIEVSRQEVSERFDTCKEEMERAETYLKAAMDSISTKALETRETNILMFNAKIAMKVFFDARKRHDEANSAMCEENKLLQSINLEISKLDINEVNLDKILRSLGNCIKALTVVREQWEENGTTCTQAVKLYQTSSWKKR